MSVSQPVDVGIVGTGNRGQSLGDQLTRNPQVRLRATCDTDAEAAERTRRSLGAAESYADYGTMLSEARLDAVVVATPMPMHATHSIAALERDLHVFSEVPAVVSMEQAEALVEAARESDGRYMLGENYVYRTPNVLVRELVDAGLFGEVYYAEGEYLHELRDASWARDEPDRWRREWQTGRNGITYPTHSLGPVPGWLPDDRVARLSCAGSGHHYTDPEGNAYEQEDTTVMLAETERDRLVAIRQDMLSERPHAMDNYQLQGTDGCYESARSPEESNRIWLSTFDDATDSGGYEWRDLAALEAEYLPDRYLDPPEAAEEAGHGGGDYYQLVDFVDSLVEGVSPPIGIHDAMDMTLPGLVSQRSIADDRAWLNVPDSREW